MDTYLQETLRDQEKTLQKKTRKRREKNRGNLGRNQSQKTPRPSYEPEKITIINENIYIIYIPESNINSLNVDQTSIELSAIFGINQLI